jgi:hypothetical protein
MALLSDFFVAAANELDQLDLAKGPATHFRCLRASRTDVVKIVRLQCLVDGTRFEDRLGGLDSLFVRTAGDDGPWIIGVPEPLVSKLATCNEEEINSLGTRWAKTEEWVLDGGKPENIVPLLLEIVKLARQAEQENKKLYVWISL